jgi:hypothetical protein|tara:strand:+ start:605 stop:874 length:270 start_codon:yes stop_codon:yes gene_type:complete
MIRFVEFSYDIFQFEVTFNWEKGMTNDGYIQPDDPDRLEIDATYMTAFTDEEGHEVKLPVPADVTYLMNKDAIEARDKAIDEALNPHIV